MDLYKVTVLDFSIFFLFQWLFSYSICKFELFHFISLLNYLMFVFCFFFPEKNQSIDLLIIFFPVFPFANPVLTLFS